MSQLNIFDNLPLSFYESVDSLKKLVGLAVALGAARMGELTASEAALVAGAPVVDYRLVLQARNAIEQQADPLGELFCHLKTAAERRPAGATYTPEVIIAAMTRWALRVGEIERVVDAGAGSGRFTVAAGRAFPKAQLIAVENDPLAALLLRAHVVAAGLAARTVVLVQDYQNVRLSPVTGKSLFWGNPPYVRHHVLPAASKAWLSATASQLGLEASQLAGLHAYFFLATAKLAAPGDVGIFITAAEWLDVNYGRLIRQLLVHHLGLESLHVIEPEAMPFEDAATTAVITGFEIGSIKEVVGLQRVADALALNDLNAPQKISRQRLAEADRWTPLTRTVRTWPTGYVELGELCRVHRGQVTGANKVWVEGSHTTELPDSVRFASITRAAELIRSAQVMEDVAHLKRVIDLPENLDELLAHEKRQVEKFLLMARQLGADQGYVARHRRAWWSVGLREPAPILATYMARRTPVFVRNRAQARHINIAHGIYPRVNLTEAMLLELTSYLSCSTSLEQGRTYAGGLTKFEPREMERLMVPNPEMLAAHASQHPLS